MTLTESAPEAPTLDSAQRTEHVQTQKSTQSAEKLANEHANGARGGRGGGSAHGWCTSSFPRVYFFLLYVCVYVNIGP